MTIETIAPICSYCESQLPIEDWNSDQYNHCPGCDTSTKVAVFPTLIDKTPTTSTARNIIAGESSCFYHTEKKAVLSCSTCGRFLCTLCDLGIDGKHICPDCLSSGKRKKTINILENRFTRYDSLMLALVFFPILMWPFLFFTAPSAIFFSIWSWQKPVSVFPKKKTKTLLAIVFASIEIVGITLFIYFVFLAAKKH